jgi:hypothetical protein
MATFNKFDAFVELTAEKVLNLGSDTLVIALTNTVPTSAMDFQNDLTEISYTNLSARTVTTTSSSQTGGLYKLVLQDLTLTASGAVATFRYAVLYDSTPGTAATNPLIGWWDYGSAVTMQNGETFIVDFSAVNGVLTIQ